MCGVNACKVGDAGKTKRVCDGVLREEWESCDKLLESEDERFGNGCLPSSRGGGALRRRGTSGFGKGASGGTGTSGDAGTGGRLRGGGLALIFDRKGWRPLKPNEVLLAGADGGT